MFWYVLYVKPKSEKKVAKQLEDLGFNVYCPLITTIKQWSDRKKKVELPLISSCIFIIVEEKERNDVFHVPGVVRYLFYLGEPAKVRDHEITILRDYLKGTVEAIEIENIKPGDTYLIPEGPFKGKEGIVNEISTNRLQLVLKSLGMKITVTKEEIH